MNTPNARKQRQLKNLANRLHQLIVESGGKTSDQIRRIISKMKCLVNELRQSMSLPDLRKVLGAAALFFGLAAGQQAKAQTVFAAPITNPFGLTQEYSYHFPAIADLDGDGDQDILLGGEYSAYKYFENTGSASIAQFGVPVQTNPFGLDTSSYIAFPDFADLDNDGDFDLLVGTNYGPLQYYENTGTSTSPQFGTAQINPFGLLPGYYFSMPAFVDLDGDGDLDILMGEYYGSMVYQENIGTVTNPNFGPQQQNPFGITPVYEFAFPDFGDLDNDGDYDLIVAEYYGSYKYFENTGSATIAQFQPAVVNPFGLDTLPEITDPEFVDLDNDGDLDLLVTNYYSYSNILYYENITPIGISESENTFDLLISPNPVEGILTISTSTHIAKIEVIDATGRTVLEFNDGRKELNVSELEAGNYIVSIRNEDGLVSSEKFLKR